MEKEAMRTDGCWLKSHQMFKVHSLRVLLHLIQKIEAYGWMIWKYGWSDNRCSNEFSQISHFWLGIKWRTIRVVKSWYGRHFNAMENLLKLVGLMKYAVVNMFKNAIVIYNSTQEESTDFNYCCVSNLDIGENNSWGFTYMVRHKQQCFLFSNTW